MDDQLNPYAAPSTEPDLPPLPPVALARHLRLTALGLRFVCGGTFVMAAAWLTALVAGIIGRDVSAPTVVSGVIAIIGILIINIGPVLCLSAPSGYGLRAFAIATVVVQGLGFAGFSVTFVLRGMFVMLAVFLIALFASSLFLIFIYRLAECLKRRDLVTRTRRVGAFWAAVVFALFPTAMISGQFPLAVEMILMIGYFAAVATALISYALLASAMANAIGRVMPPA